MGRRKGDIPWNKGLRYKQRNPKENGTRDAVKRLVLQGVGARAIAERLGKAAHTVREVRRKLGLRGQGRGNREPTDYDW